LRKGKPSIQQRERIDSFFMHPPFMVLSASVQSLW
jgi:hypothetical protein